MVIEPQGNWEQSAYQADKRFIIDVRAVVEDPTKLVQGSKTGYAGEKLSLNFQNIDVRSVLQVIADFTGFNIITSDTVTGNLTLRLKDVPWDQALDIIMQSKGLSMRKTGNVIWIAPSEEVAAKEKLLLESTQQIDDLEPMRTEVFTLRYQKADLLKSLISDAKQKILSKRGSAVVDVRTNTLFVQDTPRHLEEVQQIINKIDIAVKQVMIESRIVIADERFGKSLGARFGVQQQASSGSTRTAISGTLGSNVSRTVSATGQVTETVTSPLGSSALAATGTSNGFLVGTSPGGTQDLNVNLPVAGSFGNFAFSLFRLPAGFMLNLELSALETDKRGKVVSSPRVTTANQQKAIIEQGTEIPYLQATSSGATSVSFKKASLSLEVTPQITPDEKIIMDLEVKKDSVGQLLGTATASIPSIDTQRVQTQVLVANGETAVLGGIYQQTERTDVDKVPFLGDLPFIGNVFKRTTRQNDKTELLIFITPKVMDENLGLR
jgi:type IV pilus assembly protein PilQ